jgi:nickel-dependent lactate racemase
LNEERAITGVFAGDLLGAHKAGFEFVRRSAMQKVKQPLTSWSRPTAAIRST